MTDAAIQKRITKLEVEVKRLKTTQSTIEKVRSRLRTEILKGIASGPGSVVNAAYWRRLHALARRHASKA